MCMLTLYSCAYICQRVFCLLLIRPQAVMATGQVLFHRFYCKKSFAKFSVKRVAASCVWLASKLEECPRRAKQVIIVFQRMECRRENLPVQFIDNQSKKYADLKQDLIRTERHLLKEMGFICHVEHPHKFISNYLRTLETPPELLQEAWNLANDSLRTTLCVRFKSEVVACGVVYAAARRFHVALPENLPWWLAFDADKAGVDEVCRVLAHLYSLPKAQYIKVFKDNDSFTSMSKSPEHIIQVDKDDNSNSRKEDVKSILDKVKDSNKNEDDNKCLPTEVENKEDTMSKPNGDYKSNANTERRENEIGKARDRDSRGRESNRDIRGRDSYRDSRGRDYDIDRERDKVFARDMEKDRWHRSKDKGVGLPEKSRHHSSQDRSECHASHFSHEWDRHEHHRYS